MENSKRSERPVHASPFLKGESISLIGCSATGDPKEGGVKVNLWHNNVHVVRGGDRADSLTQMPAASAAEFTTATFRVAICSLGFLWEDELRGLCQIMLARRRPPHAQGACPVPGAVARLILAFLALPF